MGDMLRNCEISSKAIVSINFENAVHVNKLLVGTPFKLFKVNPGVSTAFLNSNPQLELPLLFYWLLFQLGDDHKYDIGDILSQSEKSESEESQEVAEQSQQISEYKEGSPNVSLFYSHC